MACDLYFIKLLKSKEASHLKNSVGRRNRHHKGPGTDSKGPGEPKDGKDLAWLQHDKFRREWRDWQKPCVDHGRSLDFVLRAVGNCRMVFKKQRRTRFGVYIFKNTLSWNGELWVSLLGLLAKIKWRIVCLCLCVCACVLGGSV